MKPTETPGVYLTYEGDEVDLVELQDVAVAVWRADNTPADVDYAAVQKALAHFFG
jgi:hypothetical protein